MADLNQERTRLDIRIIDIKDRRIFKDSDSDAYLPLDVNYNTFYKLLSPDSPTFDEYLETDFSNIDETMDRTLFRSRQVV